MCGVNRSGFNFSHFEVASPLGCQVGPGCTRGSSSALDGCLRRIHQADHQQQRDKLLPPKSCLMRV